MHLQLPVVVRFPLWQSLHIAALMCANDVPRMRTFFDHAPLLSGYSHTHHSCPINFQIEGCLSKASFIWEKGGTSIAGIVYSRAGWGFKKCPQHSPLHWSQWPPQGLLGSGTGNGRKPHCYYGFCKRDLGGTGIDHVGWDPTRGIPFHGT